MLNSEESSQRPVSPIKQQVLHALFWLSGVIAILVPFVHYWPVQQGEFVFYLRQGRGFFGDNVMIWTALAAFGAIVSGSIWRFIIWLKGGLTTSSVVFSVISVLVAVIAMINGADQKGLLWLVPVIWLIAIIFSFFSRLDKSSKLPKHGTFKCWLNKGITWNYWFFAGLFIVLILNNAVVLLDLSSSGAEIASALIGRVLFYTAVLVWLYLFIQMLQNATPRILRWLPWTFWSLLPFLAVLDLWLIASIGRPLRGFVNGMTANGEFDMMTELQAGGISGISQTGAYFILLAFVAICAAAVFGQWRLSSIFVKKTSWGKLLATGLLMTVLANAEQGIGAHWKRITAWQAEHKSLMLHFGLFTPPRGVGYYTVEFYKGSPTGTEGAVAQKEPDIYVFMIESMRADAMSAEVTPFLQKFAEEDCQQLTATWSGSNGTHLSWFSMMHSQLPIYWRGSLESISDKNDYAGPVGLRWMKNAGYRMELRAVCDLGYKDFGLLNCGSGTQLMEVVEQSLDGTEYSTHNIPQREVIAVDKLKASIASRPEGGGFYYTALDSPHYGYYWHNDFTPPFKDYIDDASFPLRPSPDEVQLYWNRYLNACAWVDHLVGKFCEHLKAEGRYDNSIIVITGDHGEEFQERGRWCHCSSLYPEQTQVPLLIKWPKSAGRGVVRATASHLDVMPSLLTYLGAPESITSEMAGVSLLEAGEATAISTTSYAGNTGETMVLRRGDYAAYFSWPRYWLANVPEKLSLECIERGGERLMLDSPDEYLAKLKELFPDAFDRFIKEMKVIKP